MRANALFQPKCKDCSGFEEKLPVTKTDNVNDEVSLMQKHEIIRRMASTLGSEAESLAQAEDLFDNFKYMISEYVLKHEFNCESKLSVQMVLWLEEKCQPHSMNPLQNIIGQYLTKRV